MKRHYSGNIVIPDTDEFVARMLEPILSKCKAAHAAVLCGDRSRQRDLCIGTDVELGPKRPGQPPCAAVVQLAVADLVVVIPLEVLTRPTDSKPFAERAVLVRPAVTCRMHAPLCQSSSIRS